MRWQPGRVHCGSRNEGQGGILLRNCVNSGRPEIASLRGANVADSRKGEMRAGYPQIIFRGHFENPKTLLSRRPWICVKRTPERRIRKLQSIHQHQITHDDQRLGFALDHVRRVAGSVPMRLPVTPSPRRQTTTIPASASLRTQFPRGTNWPSSESGRTN